MDTQDWLTDKTVGGRYADSVLRYGTPIKISACIGRGEDRSNGPGRGQRRSAKKAPRFATTTAASETDARCGGAPTNRPYSSVRLYVGSFVRRVLARRDERCREAVDSTPTTIAKRLPSPTVSAPLLSVNPRPSTTTSKCETEDEAIKISTGGQYHPAAIIPAGYRRIYARYASRCYILAVTEVRPSSCEQNWKRFGLRNQCQKVRFVSEAMGSEHYCLRWNNHQNNLLGVFSQLLRDESLVDVTLACSEGHSIRAHKVVLSACSSYFQTLFLDHPSRHPIVILKDVRFAELRTLIEFMYKGEVNVEYCQLSALLKTAESLKVKGLAEMTNLGPGRTSSSSSADYAQELEPEQMEPTELVSKRMTTTTTATTTTTTGVTTIAEEQQQQQQQQQRLSSSSTPPPSSAVVRTCGRTPERSPSSIEAARSDTPMSEDCRPSDMSLMTGGHNGNNATTCSALGGGGGSSSTCNRISSPISNEPLPGPSSMPPVQQVPLSLKKEVDWTSSGPSSDDKNMGESSLDYQRQHSHDTDNIMESGSSRDGSSSPRLFPCMYCGTSFPHQSKLTRHILSHSLETLKYRELQHRELQQHLPPLAAEPINLMETHFSCGGPRAGLPVMPHEPPDPTDQPPTAVAMDFGVGGGGGGDISGIDSGGSGVVLCKFCGKSFPDVSSLIGHLPVHTGDRPFKCEFCGKAFKLRHHMKDHCRVHTGERPFRCALCGKTFSRSTILKAHEKTHYPKYVRKFLSPSPLDTEEESPH
ncbi:putative nuclear pore complex protein [Trypoxylus dichotomus]